MATQRAVKLERAHALLAALGHPEQRFPSVLVAGTKGKGSTSAMLSTCLQSAGYHTARYTSPHLINWRERTWIDGQPIATDAVVALVNDVRQAVAGLPSALGPPTTFEVGTALSFLHFARERVDLAVVEVGTGGRFDATNLVDAVVAVVAPVSYDHTATLGATLTSIAWHKAGIMRPWRPAVSAPQLPEAQRTIEAEARLLQTPLEMVGREWRWQRIGERTRIESSHADIAPFDAAVGLLGDHQRDNATTAVAALHALRPRFTVGPDAMRSGLERVDWPGRLQVLSRRPLIVLDGAHNAASAEVVRQALDTVFKFDRLLLVLGLSEGKDALGVLQSLAPAASQVLLTRSQHERSTAPSTLEPLVRSLAPQARISLHPDVASALDAALASAGPHDLVLATGSLFLVGEGLLWWRRSPR